MSLIIEERKSEEFYREYRDMRIFNRRWAFGKSDVSDAYEVRMSLAVAEGVW